MRAAQRRRLCRTHLICLYRTRGGAPPSCVFFCGTKRSTVMAERRAFQKGGKRDHPCASQISTPGELFIFCACEHKETEMEVAARHPTHTKTDAQTDTVVGTYTVDETQRNLASRARHSDARTASWMRRLNPLKIGAARSLLPHVTRTYRAALM